MILERLAIADTAFGSDGWLHELQRPLALYVVAIISAPPALPRPGAITTSERGATDRLRGKPQQRSLARVIPGPCVKRDKAFGLKG
jgi:hypothetical protein